MDIDKRVRRNRIAGFVCLGFALLNVVVVVLALVAHEKVSGANGTVAVSLAVIGSVCLRRARRLKQSPPDA